MFRVLLIHHPPLPGQAEDRKALVDAREFTKVLKDEGADLVLHGHNHKAMVTRLDSDHGPVNVIGVPSASSAQRGGKPPAAWNLYQDGQNDGEWRCNVVERSYDAAAGKLATTREFKLDIAAAPMRRSKASSRPAWPARSFRGLAGVAGPDPQGQQGMIVGAGGVHLVRLVPDHLTGLAGGEVLIVTLPLARPRQQPVELGRRVKVFAVLHARPEQQEAEAEVATGEAAVRADDLGEPIVVHEARLVHRGIAVAGALAPVQFVLHAGQRRGQRAVDHDGGAHGLGQMAAGGHTGGLGGAERGRRQILLGEPAQDLRLAIGPALAQSHSERAERLVDGTIKIFIHMRLVARKIYCESTISPRTKHVGGPIAEHCLIVASRPG
jgi:hypothetical protein